MADLRLPFGNGPVSAVDATDLKAIFTMFKADIPETDGVGAKGYNVRLLQQQCRGGSDVCAVWLRATLLHSLAQDGLLASWQEGTDFDPRVFEAAAAFPFEDVHSFDAEGLLSFLKRT
jgi:hypothetical protein